MYTEYTQPYKEKLSVAWRRFINGDPYDYAFIRPEILESWRRSRDYNVDPFSTRRVLLDSKHLKSMCGEYREILEIVEPYMQTLYSVIRGSDLYIIFLNRDGYILKHIGDEPLLKKANSTLLVPGANRAEAYAGTNAFSVACAIKKAVIVSGQEHYVLPHKDFTCCASPVFDSNNQFSGCISISGHEFNSLNRHSLGMTMAAADGITKELKRLKLFQELSIANTQRNHMIESLTTSILLLDSADNIVQVNSRMLRLMNMRADDVLNRNVYSLMTIQGGCADSAANPLDEELDHYPVSITFLHSRIPSRYFVNTSFIFDKDKHKVGTVVEITESKNIIKLTNKMSGHRAAFTLQDIIGESKGVKKVIEMALCSAKNSSSVLILGESGTGKELIAQAIHNASERRNGPFVAINCGALPKGLVESELFGYVKGAFTGADKEGHPGKFELADGGTIFLDEIGDMPLDVQVSLLRVLETKEVNRIGAAFPKRVNVRVIAATNKNLPECIEAKSFREDLYYRLNVFTITLPPLRERKEDIPLLLSFFLKKYEAQRNIHYKVSSSVLELFYAYSWKGNVRELENVIERAVNVTASDTIEPCHLPAYLEESALVREAPDTPRTEQAKKPAAAKAAAGFSVGKKGDLKEIEREMILKVIERCNGNMTQAAKHLGIGRRTLYRKMKLYDISPAVFRNRELPPLFSCDFPVDPE